MRHCIGLGFALCLVSACAVWPTAPTADGPEIIDEPVAETVDQIEETVEIAAANQKPSLIEREDETYYASAAFPPELQVIAPKLDAELRADAEMQFDKIAGLSKEMATAEPELFRPYGIGFTWEMLGHVEKLVSLKGLYYEDLGGAHPNYGLIGLLYHTETEQEIEVASLFVEPDTAQASLYPLVREGIIQAKIDRLTEYGMTKEEIVSDVDYTFSAEGTWLSIAALAPSADTDRFGGLTVYFSPYEIGPYAEGSYDITIAQADFRDLLKPDVHDLFAGEPLIPVEDDGEEDAA
ncbi:MAG: DUF3298 domain-containing protein [Henriciella sp.]|nr:DUF3298 domain-containing protein [Henriciella sp.]